MLQGPFKILAGSATPFFKNTTIVGGIITITFQGASTIPVGGAPMSNVGAAGLPGTLIVTVFANQTVTAVFDVAENGGFLYNSAGVGGQDSGVTYEIENILWKTADF